MAHSTVRFGSFLKVFTLLLLIGLIFCIPSNSKPFQISADMSAASASTAGELLGDFFIIGKDPLPPPEPQFDQVSPSVAYNPHRQEYLVVWHNERPVYPDIQAQRVGKNGQLVGGPFYIAGGPGEQRRYPDVAYNVKQQEYLVVWESIPDTGQANIYAQRVGPTGGLNGSEFYLGAGWALVNRYTPAVAYGYTSDSYMVVWERVVQNAVSGDIEGQVIPGSGIPILLNFIIAEGKTTVDHSEPDIAYNRSRNEYLVVWTRLDKNAMPNVKDVWGQALTAGGGTQGNDFYVGYHTSDDYNPSVAGRPTSPDYGGFYVVWEMEYSTSDLDIYGKSVTWNGTNYVIAATYHEISTASYVDSEPAIAYSEDNDQFFVAWKRIMNQAWGNTNIRGQVFNPSRSVVAHESLVGAVYYAEHPAVAAGPTGDFLTVWDDYPWSADRDVYGRIWGIRIYLPAAMRLP
jgi:hypothetical protein